MKKLVILLFVGLALILTSVSISAKPAPENSIDAVLFVAPDADCGGAAPCYASLQAALDVAASGDIIKMAAGVYTDVHQLLSPVGYDGPSVITQVAYISQSVTVQGGYTVTDWLTADPEINPTTLDARGLGRGLVIAGQITATVEGLRFTGGNASGLAGGPGFYTDYGGGGFCLYSYSYYQRLCGL